MARNYSYDKKYESSEEQKKRRARRNRDRRRMIASGKACKGDGMDVHHSDSKHMSKPKLISRSKNRSMK